MGSQLGNDIVYSTYRLGVVHLASTLPENTWLGHTYPGEAFAPLVITADDSDGRIVAAVNWPPKRARASFARGRMGIRYAENFKPRSVHQFRAMIATATADSSTLTKPWHLLLDRYKAWLQPHMQDAGLYPVQYPDAIRNAHGWMHVSLHWLPQFEVADIRRLYKQHSNVFPWIQFWGQMSNYQRDPGEGRKGRAIPPLQPGEKVGCCVDRPSVHHRYLPELSQVCRDITGIGGMIGFYARPKSPYQAMTTPGSAELQFLTNWIDINKRAGANTFYLDVLGARYFGEALDVAKLFKVKFPKNTIVEWPVDIYPTSFLISGSLWGGPKYSTRPGQSPSSLCKELDCITFVNFGRYLLDDRIMFLGRSNGDFMWWGHYRKFDHWTERQAFLLGAKFDAPTRFKGQRGWIDPVNPVVKSIVQEWERVTWWQRRPVYHDQVGISDVPTGIDVRRFVDEEGINLFVVDNPKALWGHAIRFDGRRIALPAKRIAILIDKVEQNE